MLDGDLIAGVLSERDVVRRRHGTPGPRRPRATADRYWLTVTSPPPPESEPAAGGGAPRDRRWPRPSPRQTWLTVALLAVLIGGGVFALVSQSGGAPGAAPGTTPRAGGPPTTAASSGPTSTVPGSSGQAAAAAARLEIGLRDTIRGCWDDAEPGARNGAYRQDYHHPPGKPCAGQGWDLVVQFFATPQAAARAARGVAAPQTAYTDGDDLIVLAADASAATRRALASQPGVHAA